MWPISLSIYLFIALGSQGSRGIYKILSLHAYPTSIRSEIFPHLWISAVHPRAKIWDYEIRSGIHPLKKSSNRTSLGRVGQTPDRCHNVIYDWEGDGVGGAVQDFANHSGIQQDVFVSPEERRGEREWCGWDGRKQGLAERGGGHPNPTKPNLSVDQSLSSSNSPPPPPPLGLSGLTHQPTPEMLASNWFSCQFK